MGDVSHKQDHLDETYILSTLVNVSYHEDVLNNATHSPISGSRALCGLWPHFQFRNPIYNRQDPLVGDQPVPRPLPIHRHL